jgi:hypothetical protein
VTKAIAQKQNLPLSKSLQLDIGISKHGTGDLRGFSFNCEYKKHYRKNIFLAFGLGSTIHDGSFPIFYSDAAGNQIDASYRYSTGGMQITSKFGVSIVKNRKNDLGLQAGCLVRYQTSSYYDELTVLYPGITGLTIPVTTIINKSPQKTLSLGGIGQIYYNYNIDTKMFIGLSAALQIDTNGDLINQLVASYGWKF